MEIAEAEALLTRIWAEMLRLPESRIGRDENFFALGGDSLSILEVRARVNAVCFEDDEDAALPIADFFTHTTVAALARHVTGNAPESGPAVSNSRDDMGLIAIIGMAGRFPGARNVEELWANLCAGVESVRALGGESDGVVQAGAPLEGMEWFDAEFFGLTPREAALMCPEQRVLLECAQETLDSAGHGSRHADERVGVFVAAGPSTYDVDRTAGFAAVVANTSPATRISYLLNLTGPSFTLDTACSSSLVAVHQACRALRDGECEMALAGGVSGLNPGTEGYRFDVGGMRSAEGHCRPFDERADGTVFACGVALVLLKRLADAQRDGNTITAVIRGSAVNNDGNAKVGYTAPGAGGQASVILQAQAAARVDATSIGYVETHGTGTRLGDPIELAALTRAFAGCVPGSGQCVLGAVKANVGHLEVAAGIAGLVKAALVVRDGVLPPAIHFREPNREIDFAATPFRINTLREAWAGDGRPRRAGVSSFGIGGTNAHVIVEEPPSAPPRESCRTAQLLLVSARSAEALRVSCEELAARLEQPGVPSLCDVAYTLQVGRRHYDWRRFVVADDAVDAARRLRGDAEEAGMSERPHAELADIGHRWCAGGQIDWSALHVGEQRRRIPLPAYPFERKQYRLEAPSPALTRDCGPQQWLCLPTWERVAKGAATTLFDGQQRVCCLLFDWGDGFGDALSAALGRVYGDVVRVHPCVPLDYSGLLTEIRRRGFDSCAVIHAWGAQRAELNLAAIDRQLESCIYSVLHLCQAIMDGAGASVSSLTLLTCNAHDVNGSEVVNPANAMLAACSGVIARELPHVRCHAIDIELTAATAGTRSACNVLAGRVVAELSRSVREPVIAIRGRGRWRRAFRPWDSIGLGEQASLLREGGVYLVTGGTGGMGLAFAEYLAESGRAKLILTSRTGDERLPGVETSLRRMREAGASVLMLKADVGDPLAMTSVVEHARARFGRIDGVVHAAGVPGGGVIAMKSPDVMAAVLSAKVAGTCVVWSAVRELEPDFFLCCSSLASVLTPPGQFDYAAANAFQDAFAHRYDQTTRTRVISVSWDAWRDVGMAADAQARGDGVPVLDASHGFTREEGKAVFGLVLASAQPHWLACRRDISLLQRMPMQLVPAKKQEEHGVDELPKTAVEEGLARIWQELLGREHIGLHEDFLDLGGDSLVLVEMARRIESRFGRTCVVRELMQHQTISAMATLIQ